MLVPNTFCPSEGLTSIGAGSRQELAAVHSNPWWQEMVIVVLDRQPERKAAGVPGNIPLEALLLSVQEPTVPDGF